MTLHSSKDAPHPEDKSAAALSAGVRLLSKTEDTEDEPLRYASPPCYLAEFSDADCAAPAAK